MHHCRRQPSTRASFAAATAALTCPQCKGPALDIESTRSGGTCLTPRIPSLDDEKHAGAVYVLNLGATCKGSGGPRPNVKLSFAPRKVISAAKSFRGAKGD